MTSEHDSEEGCESARVVRLVCSLYVAWLSVVTSGEHDIEEGCESARVVRLVCRRLYVAWLSVDDVRRTRQ